MNWHSAQQKHPGESKTDQREEPQEDASCEKATLEMILLDIAVYPLYFVPIMRGVFTN